MKQEDLTQEIVQQLLHKRTQLHKEFTNHG